MKEEGTHIKDGMPRARTDLMELLSYQWLVFEQ
jgi:hypothetical protein